MSDAKRRGCVSCEIGWVFDLFSVRLDIVGLVGQTRARMTTAPLLIPNSVDDFRELREGGFEYIDKSQLISEFIDRRGHKVVLVPRPRRFGKTINLTMLKWYFEKRDENLWHLFDGLRIAHAGEAYRKHFQKYPVIHLSFKGTNADTWEACFQEIQRIVRDAYAVHRAALDNKLESWQFEEYRAILEGTADNGLLHRSLYNLIVFLHAAHGVRPMVLIDEYDAPIHAGHVQGYYDKVVSFFRSFLEASLKDNVHLERAFMTGILRVSKESIFSGLNNPGVYTLLESEFRTCFGFNEEEVRGLLMKAGLSDMMESVRSFYDGYDFGGLSIYNPWSILEFLASNSKKLQSYWVNTSQNDLAKRLLLKHAFVVEEDIHTLMMGGKIEKWLDNAIAFPDLETRSDTLWSILALTGYLKASVPAKYASSIYVMPYELSIPNEEVASVYRQTFALWLEQGLSTHGGQVKKLTDALLQGDVDTLQEQLEKLVSAIPSYHDVRGVYPEKFYHGLVIGLLATLEPTYKVRSNPESGAGRPDVLIRPHLGGDCGVVMELKPAGVRAKRTLARALALGQEQIREKDYTAELRALGLTKIHAYVVAFDGKKVVVQSADKPLKKKKATPKKAPARKK